MKNKASNSRLGYFLAIIVFNIVCATILFEIGVRLYNRQENQQIDNRRYPQYRTEGMNYHSQHNFAQMIYHPLLAYRPRFPHNGKGYSINNLGFRYQEDIPLERPEDEYLVIVLGGSFAFGAGVPDGYTFFEVAERELKRRLPNSKIRVISGGVGAYQSIQEILYYTYYVRPLKPDLVIFISGWNDTYFGFQGRRQSEGNDALSYRSAIEGSFDGRIVGTSGYAGSFSNSKEPPLWDDYNLKIWWLVKTLMYSPQAMIEEQKRKRVLPEEVVSQHLDAIRMLSGLEKLADCKLAFLLQPNLYSTTKPLHPDEDNLLNYYYANIYPDMHSYQQATYAKYRETFPKALDALGIEYIDTDSWLSQGSNEDAFWADQVHFGEVGQEWMGKHLAEYIEFTINSGISHK